VQRFFNEARAVTAIAAPGIVQVFDSGHANGSAYIVMELLEGEAMDARLRRIGRFSPADAVRLMAQIATSLGAAHAKGVVHRDVKPENIFLVRDAEVPGGERPKLVDFGIAKLTTTTAAGDGHQSARTRTGVLLGTPLFMSPEQCRGAGKIDHRSDMYSLGCIAYNMLAEKPPFPLEGFGEIIAAHINEPPPSLRARLPGLPIAVESLVMQMLAKSPADRPQTMDALVATIDHLQHTVPGAQPGQGLLGLVPPQAPEIEIRVPSPVLSPPPTPRPTTHLPSNTPTPPAFSGAKSGGTRLLPSEPGTRRSQQSTLGTAASEIETARRLRPEPGGRRGLVLIPKLKATPEGYPRRAGSARKAPL